MSLDLSLSADLQTPEIFEFIFSNRAEYESDRPNKANYSFFEKLSNESDPNDQLFFYAQIKEKYSITKGRSLLGYTEILIPVKQEIKIKAVSNLLILNSLEDEKKQIIINSFQSYSISLGIEPDVYMYNEMNKHKINPDTFAVLPSFAIEKIGSLIEFLDQRDLLLSTFSRSSSFDINTGLVDKERSPSYFYSLGYKLDLVSRTNLLTIEQQPKDPIRDIEGSDTSAIDDLIRSELNHLDCSNFDKFDLDVATVLAYPEFKTEFGWRYIKIGCIKMHVPWMVTYTRVTRKILNVYVTHPSNLHQFVVEQIRVCAKNSAIAGIVVAVVLVNLPAGLATFLTLFGKCILNNVENGVDCLHAGLYITSATTKWRQL